MNRIQLLPFGSIPAELLAELRNGLSREFAVPCELFPAEPDPRFAFNATRQQYLSTQILASMIERGTPPTTRLLGITLADLYIPILTFVFGEAQLEGNCALVSAHRLRQEFYGLPSNSQMLHDRLLKESTHELGHTLTLTHCEDYQCVMFPSHGVEWIDLKTSRFCDNCRSVVRTNRTITAAL